MKLTLEGTPEEIKKLLIAIVSSDKELGSDLALKGLSAMSDTEIKEYFAKAFDF